MEIIFHRNSGNVLSERGELYITPINTDSPLSEIQVYENLAQLV